jgi:hypothetical protein
VLRVLFSLSRCVAQVGVFLFEDCGGDMADMAGVWGMYIIC